MEDKAEQLSNGFYTDRRQRLKTMRLSIIEGSFAVIALGLQQAFYIPYLNQMGASKLQIGIGAGLPTLMTGIIQIWAPLALLHTRAYKKIVTITTIAQALCFVPFALVYYIASSSPVWYSISAITVSAIAAGLGAAAWADWMSYIVPARRRGRYFAVRNRVVTVTQLFISVVASRLLDSTTGRVMLVFTIIWFACFISRTVSGIFFMYHYEPEQIKRQSAQLGSFTIFLRRIFSSTFGRFALALSLLNFALNFSNPFLIVYMLNDLKLSYMQYTIIQLTPAAAMIVVVGLWGHLCDRLGNVVPMRISVTIQTIILLPWIVTTDFRMLLFFSVIGGIATAGFTLASFNYTIGAVEPARRTSCIAYLNVISSVCIFGGSALGGLIGPLLPSITTHQLHSVFLLSTIFRLAPLIIFQIVPDDKPKHTKTTAVERFFFDPRLALWFGSARSFFGKWKRPM